MMPGAFELDCMIAKMKETPKLEDWQGTMNRYRATLPNGRNFVLYAKSIFAACAKMNNTTLADPFDGNYELRLDPNEPGVLVRDYWA